jgi:DNA-binding response OmpR family regulator
MPRVLVVDDDRAIRELLIFAFECEGYTVRALGDGALVEAVLAEATEPYIVLMDLMMPYVDGWEVCRRLREHTLWRHRVIILTACPLSADTLPEPACLALSKPFDLNELLRLVANQFADLEAHPVAQVTHDTPPLLAS